MTIYTNGPQNRSAGAEFIFDAQRVWAARMLLTAVILVLTAATTYIHAGLGGALFTLNALGYGVLGVTYAISVAAPHPIAQRFGWLPRLGLAGYALLTVGAYLVMGPYFSLGWIAKGIEVAIIGLVLVDHLYASAKPAAEGRALSTPRRVIRG